MADERQIIPENNEPQQDEPKNESKVSYSKTRSYVANKYRPRHFTDSESEKSYKQLRLEKTRIRIRKIKRLNIFLTILTAAVLFAMFMGSGLLFPKTTANIDPEWYTDSSLTVDFAGDVMFGRYITQLTDSEGYDAVFHGVGAYLQHSDLAFANLDGAVLKEDVSNYKKANKENNLYCTYDALNAVVYAGINVLSLANDHAYDYRNQPLEELVEYCKQNNINYSGIGMNIDDAARYTIIDKNGYRIAFVSITDVYSSESLAKKERSGVLSTNYGDYNRLVNRASNAADITIVYMHWGKDSDIARNGEQQNLAHRLIDAGADIVVGSHPHVLQEIEKYRDGIIFYSLGNFIYDSGSTYNRDSVLVELNLDKSGNAEFTLIPVRVNNGAPEVTDNFVYRTRINRELTQSLSSDDYYKDGNEYVVVKLDKSFERTAAERDAAAAATEASSTAPTDAALPTEPAAPAAAPEAVTATEPAGSNAPTSSVAEPAQPTLAPVPNRPAA